MLRMAPCNRSSISPGMASTRSMTAAARGSVARGLLGHQRVEPVGCGHALGGVPDAATDVLCVVGGHRLLASVRPAPSASRVRARCSRVVTVDSFAPTALAASA